MQFSLQFNAFEIDRPYTEKGDRDGAEIMRARVLGNHINQKYDAVDPSLDQEWIAIFNRESVQMIDGKRLVPHVKILATIQRNSLKLVDA